MIAATCEDPESRTEGYSTMLSSAPGFDLPAHTISLLLQSSQGLALSNLLRSNPEALKSLMGRDSGASMDCRVALLARCLAELDPTERWRLVGGGTGEPLLHLIAGAEGGSMKEVIMSRHDLLQLALRAVRPSLHEFTVYLPILITENHLCSSFGSSTTTMHCMASYRHGFHSIHGPPISFHPWLSYHSYDCFP